MAPIGRKLVFSLALLGMALGVLFVMMVLWWEDVFPTAFVALGSVFYVIGGGNAVSMGILLSIVSNVIPDDQRAVAFMRLQVSGLVGSLISPALSSAMMAITGPWPVMPVAVACLVVGAMAFLFVPETIQHKDEDGEETGLDSPHIGFKDHTLRTLSQLKESLSIGSSPPLFLLILTCLATTPFATGVLQFLVQFVSKRYSVPIKNTGYIQMTYGLLQIIQALIILPWISNLLLKPTIAPTSTPTIIHIPNEPKRDLLLAKYSFYSILIGFLILGFAPSIAVFMLGLTILAIGSCYNSLVRSLMSLYVDEKYLSRLFSLVGMVEIIGSLFGAPMMAGLFTLGMRLGGGWIGLPYYGLAGLCGVCIGILWFVRLPERGESEEER
ncbi:major facilitator superfamily transporter protein [Rutstroemia sp. NJR-2017a BVV2]|nr:major facilitator superfamily transporter protein [Rutstroemia sp. NJR-2017a BVV2]